VQAGCHGRELPAAGLNLLDTPLDSLKSKSSALCSGWSLVVPGSPEQSLLYQKLVSPPAECGERMPLGLHLADAAVGCVGDWIRGVGTGGCETCGGSECIAFASDPAHCGSCDRACPAGTSCVDGSCNCAQGLEACSDTCADLSSNPQHCGACGTACGPGAVCLNGTCASDCGTLDQCGTSCVDTQSALENCGACGTACGAGEACLQGSCQCAASGSVSFAKDVEPILDANCTSAGCHTGARPKEALALDSGKAYAELVNVTTSQCGGKRKLVVPGSPSTSYLMQKLLNIDVCTGSQMPKAGQSLKQAELDAISGWICAGAPDN
jgi:hypothetical protein